MNTIEDGGPAFPVSTRMGDDAPYGHQDSTNTWQFPGMTLRDYFATAELAKKDGVGVCDRPEAYARIADHCYRMADAMLKAREEKP